MNADELDRLSINTIRFLAVDAVEQARSGHPGLPLGAAPMAYLLWTRFLRHDHDDPRWWDRDRFVLSAGHGSALLYALLHLFGYDLSLDELRRFRQWGSRTPGHPESHLTAGVEASTGPLGQGLANAVGMAIGEAHLGARYNRPAHQLFQHHTFVLASDGDVMEGVSAEASSLAGHLRLGRRFDGALPDHWSVGLPRFEPDAKGMATRKASEAVLRDIARVVPEVVGGSGDLDPSTFTWLQGDGDFEPTTAAAAGAQGTAGGDWSYAGRNIHFGVREHAMGAAVNGLVYHGGFIPFGATFLVFSDYMRAPIRLAALAHLRSIFVFTHDSIGLGEDGPSHQAVEQLASLRAIPGVLVIRPGDANETRVAWQVAIETHDRPTVLVLSRQAMPTLDRARFADADGLRRGAYVLDREQAGAAAPHVILMATGSELSVAVEAAATLRAEGIAARVVSFPCWRLFEEQDAAYRDAVLPPAQHRRVSVEAGVTFGWRELIGDRGVAIGIDRYGASAPGEVVLEKLGITAAAVVEAVQRTAQP